MREHNYRRIKSNFYDQTSRKDWECFQDQKHELEVSEILSRTLGSLGLLLNT